MKRVRERAMQRHELPPLIPMRQDTRSITLQPGNCSLCYLCRFRGPDLCLSPCNHRIHARCAFPWPLTHCPACSWQISHHRILKPEPFSYNGEKHTPATARVPPRCGRWSTQELRYAMLLKTSFTGGMLPMSEKTKLGLFLCNILRCTPARLSSKLRTGKKVFQRTNTQAVTTIDVQRYQNMMRKLSESEDLFLREVAHEMATPVEAATLALSIQLEWRIQFLQYARESGQPFSCDPELLSYKRFADVALHEGSTECAVRSDGESSSLPVDFAEMNSSTSSRSNATDMIASATQATLQDREDSSTIQGHTSCSELLADSVFQQVQMALHHVSAPSATQDGALQTILQTIDCVLKPYASVPSLVTDTTGEVFYCSAGFEAIIQHSPLVHISELQSMCENGAEIIAFMLQGSPLDSEQRSSSTNIDSAERKINIPRLRSGFGCTMHVRVALCLGLRFGVISITNSQFCSNRGWASFPSPAAAESLSQNERFTPGGSSLISSIAHPLIDERGFNPGLQFYMHGGCSIPTFSSIVSPSATSYLDPSAVRETIRRHDAVMDSRSQLIAGVYRSVHNGADLYTSGLSGQYTGLTSARAKQHPGTALPSNVPPNQISLRLALDDILEHAPFQFLELWAPVVLESGQVIANVCWASKLPELEFWGQTSSELNFLPGEDIVGRVYKSGVPEMHVDLLALSPCAFGRVGAAKAAQLRTAHAFPLISSGKRDTLVAVLYSCNSQAVSDDMAQYLLYELSSLKVHVTTEIMDEVAAALNWKNRTDSNTGSVPRDAEEASSPVGEARTTLRRRIARKQSEAGNPCKRARSGQKLRDTKGSTQANDGKSLKSAQVGEKVVKLRNKRRSEGDADVFEDEDPNTSSSG